MKKILSTLLSTLGVIQATSPETTPPGLADAQPVKQLFKGFQKGDKFYNYLSFKRVNGKRRVKR